MVQGQVSLIESVAKFDKQFSQNVVDGGAGAATILQVTNAYSELGGFGKTGEFTLGIVRGDKIEFISEFRFPEKNARKIVPLTVDEGGEPIPMQQALNTGAGWMTGPDYRCEQKPRLILFDLMMPVMDGFDFLLEMRANADWQDILVIVLTAKDLTDENRHILSGRVEQIVEKGACSHAHLLEIIRSRAT
jgi:CheY-like chemotaxis protein